MRKRILYILIALALASFGMRPSSTSAANNAQGNKAAVSSGITYYVDNTNSSCSNVLNDGLSPSTPFCTISRGVNDVAAGDTVRVLHGTYAETVKPINSGTADSPITFSADSGVTVSGEPGNSTDGGGFRMYGKSYITIEGFTITGTADYGIIVTASDRITISNNHVSFSGTTAVLRSGIYLTSTTNSNVIGNITNHNTLDGIRLNNASNNNWIEKNISYGNAAQLSRRACGINLRQNSNYNYIIRNTTYGNEDSGLNFYTGSSHNAVINNLTYGNGDHGIDNNGASYNWIVGNTVQGNVTVGINLEMDTEGNGSGGSIIMNNILADNGYRRNVGGGTFTTSNPGNLRVDTTSITSPAATTADYNIYYSGPSYTDLQIVWGTGFPSLAAFQATGQEAHGLQADPKFSAPAPIAERPPLAPYNMAIVPGDYRLSTGSPAIDSAISSAPDEQTVDISGKNRVDIQDVPNTGAGPRAYDDRGAYEYQPKLSQTITFTSAAPKSAILGGPTYTPTATATSGLAVTITVDGSSSAVCAINAGVVSFIGAGTCKLNANQAGNYYYNAAPQVQQSFTVGKASQAITITKHAPTSAANGATFTVAAVGGLSGNPVVYSSSGSCTNSGAVFTMTGGIDKTCYVHYNQAGNTNYSAAPELVESVAGKRYSQTITVTKHAPATAGYPFTFSVAATSDSGLTVVYSSSGICTNNLGVFTMTSAFGTCFIYYNQPGNIEYAVAPQIIETVQGAQKSYTIFLPLVFKDY